MLTLLLVGVGLILEIGNKMASKPKRDERRKARERKRNPNKLAVVCLAIFLSACGKQMEPDVAVDITVFKGLFSECMKNAPKDIHGESYRSIISTCDHFAYDRAKMPAPN